MQHLGHNRAGRWERQVAGYRAFIPAPLPPHPPIDLTPALQKLYSDAALALGRLDGSIQTLPNPDLFVFMYVRREAVLSSQIEGTRSSLQDLLAAEAHVYAADKDVAEVVNYVRAMNHGLARLSELPVSTRLIREIHERLLDGVRGSRLGPGELRRSRNWIGPAGCTLNEASFVPPPAEMVPQALGDLERFLHGGDELPILIKIGIAHAQFETIHPFLDGNGRVGRLLITFLLCESGVLHKPVLYLSHYFKRHRPRYYELLQDIRDNGAWEEWLGFFLRGVADVSAEAATTAARIVTLRETHRNLIGTNLGYAVGNGHRLLEHLFERPIVSVNDVIEVTGTSYPSANQLVERLVNLGILAEITGRTRNRRFRYNNYVSLFEEADAGPPLR